MPVDLTPAETSSYLRLGACPGAPRAGPPGRRAGRAARPQPGPGSGARGSHRRPRRRHRRDVRRGQLPRPGDARGRGDRGRRSPSAVCWGCAADPIRRRPASACRSGGLHLRHPGAPDGGARRRPAGTDPVCGDAADRASRRQDRPSNHSTAEGCVVSMRSELGESPELLERLLGGAVGQVEAVAGVVRDRDIELVLIAARGTSDHAALYGQYILGARNGLLVVPAAPSLVSIYAAPPRLHNALVIGISQSGQSPDVVAVLDEARRQRAVTVAITNDPAIGPCGGGRPRHRARSRTRARGGSDQDLPRRDRRPGHAFGGALRGRRFRGRAAGHPDGPALGPRGGGAHRGAGPRLEGRARLRGSRARLPLRDRPRMGPQTQGAGLSPRRSLLGRRLPARPHRAGPGGLPRPGGRDERAGPRRDGRAARAGSGRGRAAPGPVGRPVAPGPGRAASPCRSSRSGSRRSSPSFPPSSLPTTSHAPRGWTPRRRATSPK